MFKQSIILVAILCWHQFTYCQSPTRSESVSVNGKKIYYESYGEGDPLIFLHGYSLSSKAWRPYVSDFENGYEIFLVDLTGHGQSEPFKENLSIAAVARDVQALLNYLELDEVQAVGFSFGGDVLFQLALLDPDRISSMITIGALGTWTVEDFPQYQESFTFENRANFPWLKDSHQSDAQVMGIMAQFENYIVRVSDEELQSIRPDILIMMGDDDEGMSFDELARARKYLPKSDIWVLPNVQHSAHEEPNRAEFVRKALAFLSK